MTKSKKIGTDSVFDSGLGVIAMPDEEYQKLVAQGQALTASVSGKQWALGDLADKVVTKTGREDKLKQFAKDINFSGNWCTLERYRIVCRAFPQNRGRPRFFGSAQILATYPDMERFALVERDPGISVGKAREIISAWNKAHPGAASPADDELPDEDQPEEDQPAEDTALSSTARSAPARAATAKGLKRTAGEVQADEWLRDTKGWVGKIIVQANAAIELNEIMKCTAEQRRRITLAIEPELAVEIFEEAAKTYLRFVAWFKKALAEVSDEAKSRVKTSPKRKEPIQPEA